MEEPGSDDDVRAVRRLFPEVLADDAPSALAARTVARVMRGISPAGLADLDRQLRRDSYEYPLIDAWHHLTPERVSRLAQARNFEPAVLGLLGSHRNGYVRAAVVEHLASVTDGREVPFLAIRANDWVPPVAARASELLMQRLGSGNRDQVIATLPFILRTLAARRRDHTALLQALRLVLLSDGGVAAIGRVSQLETRERRELHSLLATPGALVDSPVVRAALSDPDIVIRARALRGLAAVADGPGVVAVILRFLHEDRVPVIRQIALSLIAERASNDLGAVLRHALLDPSARVRARARALISAHGVAIDVRAMYVERLARTVPHELAVAIEGIGDLGAATDLPLVVGFLHAGSAQVRRAALRAAAALDIDGAIPAAIAKLGDEAWSIRTAATAILRRNASRVDFELVDQRVEMLEAPQARARLLRLLSNAPKWDAAAYLLARLTDPSEEVRTSASALIEEWLDNFNRNQASPNPAQRLRVRSLFDAARGRLSTKTAKLMELSLS